MRASLPAAAVEMGGGEAADAAADDDQIVDLAGVFGLAGVLEELAVAEAVGGFKGTLVAAAHAGEGGGVVAGRLFGIGGGIEAEEKFGRRERRSGGEGGAIQKIAAVDAARHSQFAVPG